MRTLFTMGFASTFFDQPQIHPWLGQTIPTGDLNEAQRNEVYARLKDAVQRGIEVDSWIHSAGEDGQRTALGPDFTAFRGFVDYAAGLAPDVYPIYQRLGSDNIEDWWITEGDDAKIAMLIDAINGGYQIYSAKVKGVAAPAPPPIARPGVPTVIPGTLAPPVRPKPAPAPAPASKGIMPEPTILGIKKNDFLIGGGVAVGLGVLVYALS